MTDRTADSTPGAHDGGLIFPAALAAALLSSADLAWRMRPALGSGAFGVGDAASAIGHSLVLALGWALAGVLVMTLIRRLGPLGEPHAAAARWVAAADLAVLVAGPALYVAHRAFASLGWSLAAVDCVLVAGVAFGSRFLARLRPWSGTTRPLRRLACTLVALAVALVVAVMLQVHVKLGLDGAIRATTLKFVVILVSLTAALSGALEFLTRTPSPAPGVLRRVAHGAVAAAVLAVHHMFFVGQYDAVHAFLLLIAWVHIVAACVGWSPLRRRAQARLRPAFVAAAACALVWSGLTLDGRSPAGALILGWSNTNALLVRLTRVATDWDGDGASSLWGGTDVAAFDDAIHPLALEVPGNGVDENGIGGDLGTDDLRTFLDGLYAPPPPVGEAPFAGRSVVWINLCTVRADRIGAYGYTRRPSTPRLDAFADEAVLFENVCSTAPWTSLSILNNLRSRSWATYGDDVDSSMYRLFYLENLVRSRFTPDEDTLFHALADAGYRCEVVSGDRTAVRLAFGREIPVETEIEGILEDLAGGPFFLWVQLGSPHRPYVDHSEVESFGGSLQDEYDTQMRFLDLRVGAVLDALDAADLRDDTIVVVVGEHGEALNERGVVNHGLGMYETELHVPLILRAPGLAPRRVAGPVSSLDLTPTLVQMTGVKWSTPTEGRSLLAALRGEPADAGRRLFAQNLHVHQSVRLDADLVDLHPFRHQVVLRRGPLKLIFDRLVGTYELYDLAQDPRELRDLGFERLGLVSELAADLDRWIDVHDARPALREYLDAARR